MGRQLDFHYACSSLILEQESIFFWILDSVPLMLLPNWGIVDSLERTTKKHLYCQNHVPGEDISNHMKDKVVAEPDTIQRTLNGITYNLWTIKGPDSVMKMMATGSNLATDDTCCTPICCLLGNGREWVLDFVCSLPCDLHIWDHHARWLQQCSPCFIVLDGHLGDTALWPPCFCFHFEN